MKKKKRKKRPERDSTLISRTVTRHTRTHFFTFRSFVAAMTLNDLPKQHLWIHCSNEILEFLFFSVVPNSCFRAFAFLSMCRCTCADVSIIFHKPNVRKALARCLAHGRLSAFTSPLCLSFFLVLPFNRRVETVTNPCNSRHSAGKPWFRSSSPLYLIKICRKFFLYICYQQSVTYWPIDA